MTPETSERMRRAVQDWMSQVGLTPETFDQAAADPEIRAMLDRVENAVGPLGQGVPTTTPAPAPEMPGPVMPSTPQVMPGQPPGMLASQPAPLDPNQIPRTRREAEEVLRQVAPSLSRTEKEQLLRLWEQRYGA